MFGKKKTKPDGDAALPNIGAENSQVDDVLAGIGSDTSETQSENPQKAKKKLFGMFQKKSSEENDIPNEPQIGALAARQSEQSDPLAFLDPDTIHHDIVIKEITESLEGQKNSTPSADKELVATVLDSAQPQQPREVAESEPIAEAPEDNVLANAAELKKTPSGLAGVIKPKNQQDDPVSASNDFAEQPFIEEGSNQEMENAMPERNMTSLYKSMGLDETLSPDYDPNAKNEPQFVTDGQHQEGEATTPEKKNKLVSAIVQTTKKNQAEQNAILGEEITEQLSKEEEEEQLKAKAKRREKFVLASRFVTGLSLIVPLFSWIILSSLLTPDSKFSDILNSRNYGAELAGVKAKMEEKDIVLKKLNGEIAKLKQDTENIKDNKILKQVIDKRIDFLEIMLRINKITLKALNLTPELNNAIHMLVFNSYTGRIDKDKVQVSITGSVRDPKRLSISKLTQLIEAINADEYFEGAALRSFAKANDEEGGSQSSFSLSFTYFPDADKALNDSLAGAPQKK